MNKWAHIENIVIVIVIGLLVFNGHGWGLLLMLALNSPKESK
jgi:hypothetical protein